MAQETHAEEKIRLEPAVEVEETGPCRLKIHLTVSAEKIKELVDERFRKLNETVQVPGFRRGHAPRVLLERKFGRHLLEELKQDVVGKGFEEAAEEKKFELVGEPTVVDPDALELKADSEFKYAVEIETLPRFELKPYTGLTVKKPPVKVEPEEVDEAIEALRRQHATWEPVKEAAQKGDQVVADLWVLHEGKELAFQENASLTVGEDVAVFGTRQPDFYRVLLGKESGATGEYEMTVPADHPDRGFAGKTVTVRAAIKGVRRRKLPELDAEFFKLLDVDDLDDLKEEVEHRLKRAKNEEARSSMASDLLEQIVQANEFPVPEGLVKHASAEFLSLSAYEWLRQGVAPAEVRKRVQEHRDQVEEEAAREIREHLIIQKIADREKIFVTEDEVGRRIAEMAAGMGRAAGELESELDAAGLLPGLRRRMRTEKVLEFLLSKAKIEEP